jgi:monoamine oxidase
MNCSKHLTDVEPTLAAGFFADGAIQDKKILIEDTLNAIKEAWPNAPSPISVEVTAWHTDPNCYGSYAGFSNKTKAVDIVNLMQPEWNGRFVLAGDGIVPVGLQGCFHGAYISGLRAARLVHNFFNL